MLNPRLRYSHVLRIGLLFWTLGAGLKLLFNEKTHTYTYVIVLALEGIGVGWVHQPGMPPSHATSNIMNESSSYVHRSCSFTSQF